MKYIKHLGFLAMAVVVGSGLVACSGPGCATGWCGSTSAEKTPAPEAAAKPVDEGVYLVRTEHVKAFLDEGADVTLVDARSGKWDDGNRIPGAIQLAADADEDAIAAALPKKNAVIVAYCSNAQCPAGMILAKRLVNLGYTRVHKYPDGIAGWIADGHAVVAEAK